VHWDWTAIGTISALAGVGVTLFFNTMSQRQTREGQRLTQQGQKQDRELAEAGAKRSEAAARLTEEYTRRVVDALELIAESGFGSSKPKVEWSLRRDAGDRFRLENVGDALARDVTLTAHESLGGLIDMHGGPDLAPREAMTFIAAPSFETSDMTITVTWDDESGAPAGSWKYPLPYS
jgi:hypothetical protein